MSRAKTAFGIAVLFVLALGAFGVGIASAQGTTGYTCVTDGNGTLKGDHCLTTGSGSPAKHVEIKQDETTTTLATNSNTASETTAAQSATIKAALAGVTTEITCKEVSGEGSFENKSSGGEMYLHSEGKLHFAGCSVKLPAEKGCKVKGETLLTETITTTSLGQGDSVKVVPKNESGKFAEVTIEGCSIAALNNTCPITGSFKAVGPGATLTTTHTQVTTENTLKFGGQKAGLEVSMTVNAHSNAGEETHPISVTTT
ncbi:MAG TPA: hypothetical protein VFJ57_13045 [Solirubrobacterales bacterium]|nr:hypothetical protein [Solirubrobacterales bacterium]